MMYKVLTVSHNDAAGRLCHLEVLGPMSKILEVEGEAVSLGEGVQVDIIEVEHVFTAERSQGCHAGVLTAVFVPSIIISLQPPAASDQPTLPQSISAVTESKYFI